MKTSTPDYGITVLDPISINFGRYRKATFKSLDWAVSLVLSFMWLALLMAMLSGSFANPIAGLISSSAFILAVYISLFLWRPRTAVWKTIMIAWFLNMGSLYLALSLDLPPTSLLLVSQIPPALVVFLRCNSNGRKLIGRE